MRTELSLLCLLLTLGFALADVGSLTVDDSRVSVKLDVVDAEADYLLSRRYGFGGGEVNHGRGLLATYNPNVISGTTTPDVNPEDYCANYGGAASQQPNTAFRQALQSIGSNAGSVCGVPPPSNGKYIKQISTKCQRNGATSFADAIKISYNTLAIPDATKRTCFSNRLNQLLSDGTYACIVASFLPAGFQQWAPAGAKAQPCLA